MKTLPPVGTRIRLTGDFLRNTGQMTGGEGQSRWLTVACECGLCIGRHGSKFVAVNEPGIDDPTRPRHINLGNVEKCR
jgi:hypothetical protein